MKTWERIIGIVSAIVLSIGVVSGLSPTRPFVQPCDGEVVIDTETGEPQGVKLTAAKIPAEEYEEYGVSEQTETAYILTAALYPEDAGNQEVDWTVAFADYITESEGEWATGKTVTDYVMITPTSDGALTAVVENVKEFGRSIIVTVTSRDNPEAYASCRIEYQQKIFSCNLHFEDEYYFSSEATELSVAPTLSTFKNAYISGFVNSSQSFTKKSEVFLSLYVTPTEEFKAAIENAGFDSSALMSYKCYKGCVFGNFFDRVWGEAFYGNDEEKKNAFISVIEEYSGYAYQITVLDQLHPGCGSEYYIRLDSSLLRDNPPAESWRSVTYKIAGSEELVSDKFSWLLDSKGNYPLFYKKGVGARVSDLLGLAQISESIDGENYAYIPVSDPSDSNHSACFLGWYLDTECTNPFDGEISWETTDDIVLYAKIEEERESNWTGWF